MALKGQLHDFNLAEILQLIASQQKSGFLVLEGQREMCFIFDRGVLVSTRDRRSEAPDPLETFLRNYGFFTEAAWSHVAYIRQNSSIDLAEILVSEEMMTREELDGVLQNVARELAHRGMKMRRGRYHFTATKESPPGVRWRIAMDVQGLLMEAARRVDEEAELARLFPSQAVTFVQGPTPPPPDALSPVSKRVLKLALSNRPLGRIIRLARTDSFTTRELLKTFCEEGWLEAVLPQEETDADDNSAASARRRRQRSLRHPALTVLAALVLLAFGAIRWTPLMLGEMALIGLAAPAPEPGARAGAAAVSWLDEDQQICRELRERQLHAMVVDAVADFRQREGTAPERLEQLVEDGDLPLSTWQTVEGLGWRYQRASGDRGFTLAL
jgi:hypothetical protein